MVNPKCIFAKRYPGYHISGLSNDRVNDIATVQDTVKGRTKGNRPDIGHAKTLEPLWF